MGKFFISELTGLKFWIWRVTFLKRFLPLKNFGTVFRFSCNRRFTTCEPRWDESFVNRWFSSPRQAWRLSLWYLRTILCQGEICFTPLFLIKSFCQTCRDKEDMHTIPDKFELWLDESFFLLNIKKWWIHECLKQFVANKNYNPCSFGFWVICPWQSYHSWNWLSWFQWWSLTDDYILSRIISLIVKYL